MPVSDIEPRIYPPESVYVLGGGGKKTVEPLLNEKWFLKEVMREKTQDINFYFIDSATGEDRKKLEALRSEFEQNREEVRGGRDNIADINVELFNLTREGGNYSDYEGLVAKENAQELMEEGDFHNWWIKSDPVHIENDVNFANGVTRKRCISKALFHAAKKSSDSDSFENAISNPITGPSGHIAVITALGGGTGSGMFIDLAEELEQGGADITLFGILPGSFEAPKKRANAFAALSELEKLELEGENPFKNMVLLPFNPTQDNPEYKTEFDEVFGTTFLSYYSLKQNHDTFKEEISDDNPEYASFMMANSMSLRYNIEKVKELKNTAREYFDKELFEQLPESEQDEVTSLRHKQDIEAELYENIRDLLSDSLDVTKGQLRENTLLDEDISSREATRIMDRVHFVEELVEYEALESFGYGSAEEFKTRIRASIQSATEEDREEPEDDEVVQVIINLKSNFEADPPSDEVTDKDEQEFAKAVEKEIQRLCEWTNILLYNKRVDDKTLSRQTIDYLIGNYSDEDEYITGVSEVATERTENRNQKDTIEDEIEDLEDGIEKKENTVNDIIDEWKSGIEEDLSNLSELDDKKETLKSKAQELDKEIDTICSDVERGSDKTQISGLEIDLDLGEFDRELKKIGIDGGVPTTEINRDINWVKKTKEAKLKADSGGFLSGIWRWVTRAGSTDNKETYNRARRNMSGLDVSAWTSSDYNVTKKKKYADEIDKKIKQAEDDFRDDIFEHLKDIVYEHVDDEETLGRFETEVIDGIEQDLYDQLSNDNPRLIKKNIGDDAQEKLMDLLTEREKGELEDKRDQRDRLQEKENLYRKAEDIHREDDGYYEEQKEAEKRFDEITSAGGKTESTQSEDYAYRKEVEPEDIDKALERDSIDEIFDDPEEEDTILGSLRQFVDDLIDPKFLMLNERSPKPDLTKDDVEGGRYGHHAFGAAYMSRALGEERRNKIGDIIEDRLNEDVYLDDSSEDYASKFIKNGHRWDMNATLIMSGIFLDNIAQMDTYKEAYYDKYNKAKRMNRHSHGLGDRENDGNGKLIRRNDFLSVDEHEDMKHLVDWEKNKIVEQINDEMIDMEPWEGEYHTKEIDEPSKDQDK
jgi:hypothetical protein